MNTQGCLMKSATALRLAAAVLAAGLLCPAQAQVPARFYWKSLSGGAAVPWIYQSLSGNTNPFDPSHQKVQGGQLEGTLAMTGYVQTFSLFDQPAMLAFLVPMGRLKGEMTVAGKTVTEATNGYADPLIEFNVNLIGPKAQKNIPDLLRYEPGFSLDLLVDLAIPIGDYDNTKSLNLGQNRWYGRLGFPIIWQLGSWVPGRRTTLEFLPVAWFFGTNTDFMGQSLKTDPFVQLDAHLTRDLTEQLWVSLDAVWYKGGGSTIGDGVKGKGLDNNGVGFTVGYQLNENLALTCGYKSTVNDHAPDALRMDNFMVTLVYGWHPMVQGMRRLSGGN